MVNAIGGVPMYFSTRMRDNNSGLDIEKSGCITLNGDQALSFARSRHLEYYDKQLGEWKSDGTADLGRITRQQIFIRKVIGRAESKATGLNLLATNNLVHSVIKNLKVDSSFSFTDMLGLLSDYRAFNADNLVTYELPVTPFVTSGGADVLNLETAQAQPTLEVFRGTSSSPTKFKPSQVTLSVENGGGVNGEAAASATKLERYGFTISATGNADQPGNDHRVLRLRRREPGDDRAALHHRRDAAQRGLLARPRRGEARHRQRLPGHRPRRQHPLVELQQHRVDDQHDHPDRSGRRFSPQGRALLTTSRRVNLSAQRRQRARWADGKRQVGGRPR